MAHFAELDENNVVINVITVNNSELLINGVEDEQKGIAFCNTLKESIWVQTSYNKNFRKAFAFIGGTYDSVRQEFVEPQPFPSWVLDENNDWQPPVARPVEDGQWIWNESQQQWER